LTPEVGEQTGVSFFPADMKRGLYVRMTSLLQGTEARGSGGKRGPQPVIPKGEGSRNRQRLASRKGVGTLNYMNGLRTKQESDRGPGRFN